MDSFQTRVAVVTGAASGIGLALARRCAAEGMRVVLADVEEAVLEHAHAELEAQDKSVLAVRTDVSNPENIESLARQTIERFGAVHLLFNNAGVGAGRAVWDCTAEDWEWVMGVNLWGVIHAVRIFVPIMLAQKEPGHIVNTASVAGLTSGAGMGIYRMTKHAVVSLSETLYCELQQAKSAIGVSVLCPGFVNTRIMDSRRNRPGRLAESSESMPLTSLQEERRAWFRECIQQGMSPTEVADHVFKAIRSGTFYVVPDAEFDDWIRDRLTAIVERRNPTLR
jgi:NAD(P)-dependent dehydrogenase (short-subunit alcohol dehydrogenase family)